MSDIHDGPGGPVPANSDPRNDEGGLRAPPELHGWRKTWWWFDFIVLVKLARLRFIAILVVIGVVITQWDKLVAYYDRWTRPAGEAEAASSDTEYFCPMHPTIVRDNPKEKCPICFMPLSKRKKGSGEAEELPKGVVNRVQLTPYRVVLAGVQTWKVDYVPLTKEITAVGYIEFNERGERTVSARTAGRIDKLLASETGQLVREGDPLAAFYSPDLLVTMQNMRDARRSGNRELEEASQIRLRRLGVDDAQIEDALAHEKSDIHVLVRSPIGGHVIKKYVKEGQYVQEGTPLYDVADLSTVWVEAQIYEDDLAFLPADYLHGKKPLDAPGLTVSATTRAAPNEVFQGKLAFIYPHVDQQTRTVTVRFELDNPQHKLRPGSTATVTLKVRPQELPNLLGEEPTARQKQMLAEGRVLAVPEGSVIDTGSQRIVYRQESSGVFEGVEVTLGPRMMGPEPEKLRFYPVLGGLNQPEGRPSLRDGASPRFALKEGDRIVTSGSFLIDAETRLNPAAGSIYFGGSSGLKSAGGSTVRPTTPDDTEAKIHAELTKLSPEDRVLAKAQKFCPVLAGSRLGSMKAPVKLTIEGEPVFLCCSGCKGKAEAAPQETLKKVRELRARSGLPSPTVESRPPAAAPVSAPQPTSAPTLSDTEEAEIRAELAKLPPQDRALAEAQKFCAIESHNRLGTMGPPIRLVLDGDVVFLCCDGCRDEALAKPKKTAATARQLRGSHD